MPSIVNACFQRNEINCKKVGMHFVNDIVAQFSRNNFLFHSIVSWLVIDDNNKPHLPSLPSYNKAEHPFWSVFNCGPPQQPLSSFSL